MQINHEKGIILIENPRCASASLAALLGMERIEGATANMLPKAARKLVTPEVWDSYQKIIVVREPLDRFRSAVASLPDGTFEGTFTFDELANKCLDLLVTNPSALPASFKPQTDWLTSAFNLILASRDCALYANTMKFKRSLGHLNVGPVPSNKRKLSRETELRVVEAYAKDVARFTDLFVWTPDESKPHLVTGPCKACAKALADAAAAQQPTPEASAEASAEAPAQA